jgi:2-methylcitrate dehydratase PrpD
MKTAAGLADFARGLRRDNIAPSAARHATALILDAVGCALAGWDAEETPGVLRAARLLSGDVGGGAQTSTTGVTVIGDDASASPLTAVLANAYLTTAVTACDVYIP